jgi:hypothetical protein
MEKKNSIIVAVMVIAFLFAPVLYTSIAAAINKSRGLISAPQWTHIARIITVTVAILCPASLFFFQRQIRTKSADKLRKKVKDPELVIFICGLALWLAPACIAFFLFLIGNPVIDVYAYCVFSFIGIGGWSWHKRALFMVAGQVPHDMPSSATTPRDRILQGFRPIRTVRAYTITLVLLGALALALLCIKILLIVNPPSFYTTPVSLEIPWIFLYALFSIGCWTAAFLRKRGSPHATLVTAVLSTIFVIWVPFGTAAFIYWIGRVRKKERQDNKISTDDFGS